MNPAATLTLPSILLVAGGGAMGCVLRFLSVQWVARLHDGAFPLGTMFVNLVGSLIIGAMLARYDDSQTVRAFFVTGVLGGFTTFSAFSWDALQLLQRGQWAQAAFYILGSVALCIAAAWVGFALMKAV